MDQQLYAANQAKKNSSLGLYIVTGVVGAGVVGAVVAIIVVIVITLGKTSSSSGSVAPINSETDIKNYVVGHTLTVQSSTVNAIQLTSMNVTSITGPPQSYDVTFISSSQQSTENFDAYADTMTTFQLYNTSNNDIITFSKSVPYIHCVYVSGGTTQFSGDLSVPGGCC